MDLKIISSTDRPGSKSLKVSRYVATLYHKHGVEPDIISLEDFPLADVVGGPYGKEIPSITEFREPVINADGLLFVIPEYNGSFPGVLKVFVDHLPFPQAFEKLPMAFIGVADGAFGGLRAVEQFQLITNYRNAIQFPERVFIQRASKEFDPEHGLKNEFQQGLLESQTSNYIEFLKKLGR